MHPILFRFPDFIPILGGRGIHMYGLMIALGFMVAWFYTVREAKRLTLNVDRVMDLFFYTIVWGLIGSRIWYVLVSIDGFWKDPLVLFRVWESGLVFQGGVMGAFVFLLYYTRKHKFRFLQIADILSVPLALGHGLGRIGCFFAGCCYGKPCDLNYPLAVIFPNHPDTVAPIGIALYPTQLFEAFAEVLVFLFLFWFRRRKPFEGSVFLLYMMIYAVLRSVIEVYRGDKIRGFIIEPYVSVAQFLSFLAFATALFFWFYLGSKKNSKNR